MREHVSKDSMRELHKALPKDKRRALQARAEEQSKESAPFVPHLLRRDKNKVTPQDVLAKRITDRVWHRLLKGEPATVGGVLDHATHVTAHEMSDIRQEEKFMREFKNQFDKSLATKDFSRLDDLITDTYQSGIVYKSLLKKTGGPTRRAAEQGALRFGTESIADMIRDRYEPWLSTLLWTESSYLNTLFRDPDFSQVVAHVTPLSEPRDNSDKRSTSEFVREVILQAAKEALSHDSPANIAIPNPYSTIRSRAFTMVRPYYEDDHQARVAVFEALHNPSLKAIISSGLERDLLRHSELADEKGLTRANMKVRIEEEVRLKHHIIDKLNRLLRSGMINKAELKKMESVIADTYEKQTGKHLRLKLK